MTYLTVRTRPVTYLTVRPMTYLTVRTIGAILKGLAYLAGGFLFGILPLLVVLLWKILKGGTIATWKVTAWIVGTALAIIVLMLKSA